MRVGLRQCLLLVALASLVCMGARSALQGEPLGLLTWPVLAGFAADRIASGDGVLGGTIGGALGLGAAALLFGLGPLGGLVALAAGACWGFYLGVWTYMIVETILQGL
ncbi:MAG: hypothetical protein U0790_03090 [Isosphaeraceae bacterium]